MEGLGCMTGLVSGQPIHSIVWLMSEQRREVKIQLHFTTAYNSLRMGQQHHLAVLQRGIERVQAHIAGIEDAGFALVYKIKICLEHT